MGMKKMHDCNTICDVFSAGAVFYKMLNFYNKELFKGKNIKETF